ncbi:MAG: TolC family protein [Bacteroidota bacterium]
MLLRKITWVAKLLCICFFANAQQETLKLSLTEIITLAQSDAPDVLIAETILSNRYWQYQSFLADFKPQIQLGTNSSLSRAIEPIILPNGSLAFVDRSLMQNNLDVRLQQQIGATGGTIFATTGLSRIDIFNTGGSDISYLSTPISIGFNQPIFQVNLVKWDKKIRPLDYEIAEREYSEDMEQVAFETAGLFFRVLTAQLALEAATKNKSDADTLYSISKGRFGVGRIAETDLLRVELNVRSSEQALAAATLGLQSATEELRDFLGIKQAVKFELDAPYEIPKVNIDPEKALEYARQNRSTVINFERRLLEAERNVAVEKGNAGLNANINASFGLSQTSDNLTDAYRNPLDQERVAVTLQVPIADWGKTKARLETAKSNQELTRRQVSQEKISFEREILLKVQQLDLVRNQVGLANRTYEVAKKTNNITRQRYLVGKIGVTELNIALGQEETSRQAYVRALQSFWTAYYELRRLTLYDFINDRPLIQEKTINN